ncbi:hypothetical protein G6F59_016292 [Rhizopus arrhizus]|nr:hypothetical protein G6F59_016292 [Rhizopus arrhizus]
MLDLILRHCTLPDGRQNIDIGIANGRIVALEPALKAEAAQTVDAAGQLVSSPHRAVGRTQAALDAGSAGRTRAGVLRLGGGARPAGYPLACGRLRPAPVGDRSAAACARKGQTLSGPATGGLPAGRRAARAGRAGQPEARARLGCGRGVRHSAL